MLALSARFPDAIVRLVPVATDILAEMPEHLLRFSV
jgi:hypothetical protein